MSINHYKRTRIFKRDMCICQYCGKVPIRVEFHNSKGKHIPYIRPIDPDTSVWKGFEVDHIIPKDLGGGNEDENLVTACSLCNVRKGTKLIKPMNYKYV